LWPGIPTEAGRHARPHGRANVQPRIEGVMSLVVVGVDGSKHAEAALQFAAEEAALRGARLRVVHAWQAPVLEFPKDQADSADAIPGLLRAMSDDADGVVQKAMALVKELQPSVSCEPRVVEGHAGSVLLEEAGGAALIVVGSRGRSDFAGMLLGSVSHQVLHHASCPVTVVPYAAS
jgi:nucleotide-binding universal stress UspA family protein